MPEITVRGSFWDYEEHKREGTHFDIDKGYWVANQKLNAGAKGRFNAWLRDPTSNSVLPLHVYEVEASFGLAGSSAASKRITSFFPRNFQQPVITVRGQCHNQKEYARLAEFIRYTMIKGVNDAEVCQFKLAGGGLRNTAENLNQTGTRNAMKGVHEGMNAEGYILSTARGAKFGEFAPSYEFGFTVSRMLSGLFKEDPVVPRKLRSWNQIIENLNGPGFINDADVTGAGAAEAITEPTPEAFQDIIDGFGF